MIEYGIMNIEQGITNDEVLLSSEQNDEECDATEVDSSTTDDKQKIKPEIKENAAI